MTTTTTTTTTTPGTTTVRTRLADRTSTSGASPRPRERAPSGLKLTRCLDHRALCLAETDTDDRTFDDDDDDESLVDDDADDDAPTTCASLQSVTNFCYEVPGNICDDPWKSYVSCVLGFLEDEAGLKCDHAEYEPWCGTDAPYDKESDAATTTVVYHTIFAGLVFIAFVL